MKEIVLLFASILSNDDAVALLERDVQAYKLEPSEDNFNKITATCMLICSMPLVKKKGVEKAIDEANKIEKVHTMLNYTANHKS